MALSDEEEAALRAQLAQEQANGAEAAATARRLQVEGILREIGAPPAFAGVVPADMAVEPDALKGFVAQFIPPPAGGSGQQEGGTAAATLSGWDRYERAAETGTTPGAGKTEVELLVEEGQKGIDVIRGKGLDWNHFRQPDGTQPGTEDWGTKNEEFASSVNRMNKAHEMAVRRGEAEAGGYLKGAGFGGRFDPPPWAYRALDGASI